ncbi:hypothetical protein OAK97_01360 [bacterium]|jgi:uncharacterized repeat protein (TIGR04138 family)|nr:hypothetical protein [bacterium]MDG1890395.1 hypothetical protein [Verrucomicrobiota bacterium]
MQTLDFDQTIEQITQTDTRYAPEAYYFLRDALDHTQSILKKANAPVKRPQHVSGNQLLEGIREYALSQFGPMTLTVMHDWGIKQCEDFGEIVFNMVDHNLLSKTQEDTRDDFKSVYDFSSAFTEPFLPRRRPPDSTQKPCQARHPEGHPPS